jgi:hypothetical protein
MSYDDEVGGSGIDVSSVSYTLQKWQNGSGTWGGDISASYLVQQNISPSFANWDFS